MIEQVTAVHRDETLNAWRIVCRCGHAIMWAGAELKWREPLRDAA